MLYQIRSSTINQGLIIDSIFDYLRYITKKNNNYLNRVKKATYFYKHNQFFSDVQTKGRCRENIQLIFISYLKILSQKSEKLIMLFLKKMMKISYFY